MVQPLLSLEPAVQLPTTIRTVGLLRLKRRVSFGLASSNYIMQGYQMKCFWSTDWKFLANACGNDSFISKFFCNNAVYACVHQLVNRQQKLDYRRALSARPCCEWMDPLSRPTSCDLINQSHTLVDPASEAAIPTLASINWGYNSLSFQINFFTQFSIQLYF